MNAGSQHSNADLVLSCLHYRFTNRKAEVKLFIATCEKAKFNLDELGIIRDILTREQFSEFLEGMENCREAGIEYLQKLVTLHQPAEPRRPSRGFLGRKASWLARLFARI